SGGEGKGLWHWPSAGREAGVQGTHRVLGEWWRAPRAHRVLGEWWRAPTAGAAAAVGPLGGQLQLRATGCRRVGYSSEAVTGQGWRLPIVASPFQDGFALQRQLYPRDTALRRFYGRATPLHRSDNLTQVVTSRLSAPNSIAPLREVEAGTPAR